MLNRSPTHTHIPRSRHRRRQRVQLAVFEAQKRPSAVEIRRLGATVRHEIAKETQRNDNVGGRRAVATQVGEVAQRGTRKRGLWRWVGEWVKEWFDRCRSEKMNGKPVRIFESSC